jgi:hypothetical protein
VGVFAERAGGCVYGRVVGDLAISTLHGEEERTEIQRYDLRIEEEV